MALKVARAAAVAANAPFTITVPGQEIWTVIAVRAVLSRAVGGLPNRALQLTISDGTNVVITSPAADAGTEPGTLTVTWANASASAVSSGATGVSLGPLGPTRLTAGYVIAGTVVNGVATDQWTSAIAWVDYQPSGG